MYRKDLENKIALLNDILLQYHNTLVAYSGGTDSVLLLAAARKALGTRKVLAVTTVSETYTEQELLRAQQIARLLGVRHLIKHSNELNIAAFKENNIDRCYYCKQHRLGLLKEMAAQRNMVVIEGSNTDDAKDYRPGMRAIKELGIESPLRQANLCKQEIRTISKKWSLPTWNTPAQSCLATRIEFGIAITVERIRRIEKAERMLIAAGLQNVRLRDHGDIARIEVNPDQLTVVLDNKTAITMELKQLGFKYVTLDLDGYVRGSMNRVIRQGGDHEQSTT
ncbi:ATP-dependent sacrificial sulfur transferase LarE [Peptococcaceae bacterium 1198_IL3148]